VSRYCESEEGLIDHASVPVWPTLWLIVGGGIVTVPLEVSSISVGVVVENVGSVHARISRANVWLVDWPEGPVAVSIALVECADVFLGNVNTPVEVLRYCDKVEGFTLHTRAPV
jgi:hypothetical protein